MTVRRSRNNNNSSNSNNNTMNSSISGSDSHLDTVLPDFMNEEQRLNLLRVKQGGAKYHFKVINLSIAENYLLERFWEWVTVTFYPEWLAPNLITLVGFALMLFAHVLLWSCYPLVLDEGAVYAQWRYRLCCIISSICLFTYQTLDGSDGKQARRTKQSSPLGEVFDHGVDAVCLTIHVCIVCLLTLRTPEFSWYSWIPVVGMWFAFFTAHFEHHHTKCFYVGYLGVPDAQLLIVVACMVTGFTGHNFWTVTLIDHLNQWLYYLPPSITESAIPLLHQIAQSSPEIIRIITLGDVLLWSIVGGGVFGGIRCVVVVWQKSSNDLSFIVDLLPLSALSISFIAYAILVAPHIWLSHYFTTCITFGLVFGIILTTYNISRVSETPFFAINKQFVASIGPLVLLVLNSSPMVYGHMFGLHAPPVNEVSMLYLVLAYESAFYVVFATSVIRSFCRALGINAFSITREKEKMK